MGIVSVLARLRNVIYAGAVVWTGAAWMMGCVVAPTLFSFIVDRALAGSIAGFLFGVVNVSGLVIFAGVLLVDCDRLVGFTKASVHGVIAGCLLQLAVLGPLVSTARMENASWFGLAHGASTLVYLAVLAAASYWLWRLIASFPGASK